MEMLLPMVTCTISGGASATISVKPAGRLELAVHHLVASGPSVPMSPKVITVRSPPSTDW